jgi:hypothetical protein
MKYGVDCVSVSCEVSGWAAVKRRASTKSKPADKGKSRAKAA